jgi:peptide-methionine (R)-S-oxide reductase
MTSKRIPSAERTAGERLADRRRLLCMGLLSLSSGGLTARLLAATQSAPAPSSEVSIENFSPAGASLGVVRIAKLVKSDAEWRAQLSALAYQVTRREGTEVAYSGKYAANHGDGLYRCICCDTALYDSKTKYESGTGWPSFWQPISAVNVVKSVDSSLGMERDAVSCRRCDAHLGHVFDDGPRPTGLRYCMNSVALNFVQRA